MVKALMECNFEAVFECMPAPFLVMDRDFTIIAVNQAFLDSTMRARDVLMGVNVFVAFPAPEESRKLLQASLERARDKGIADVLPAVSHAVTINGRYEERLWNCTHIPVRDASGNVAYIIKSAQDISDLHPRGLAEIPSLGIEPRDSTAPLPGSVQVLNQSLLATVHHLRRLVMQAPSFMCVLRGPDLVFELVNIAFSMLAGGRDLIGKTLHEGLPETEGQDYPGILKGIFETGEVHVGRKMRILLQDAPDCEIEEHYIDFVAQPILGVNGEVTGIFIEGNDVTDHVKTEQRQSLLIRELHHRVRNTLATVQGVMNTTAKSSANIEDFQEAFSGRISSLAKTHAVMTEQLHQSVSFQQLLTQELGPYSDDHGLRIRLSGPAVDLPSQIAVPLGMAVHELTTNAVRHGALSREEGRIEVGWGLAEKDGERSLLCEWSEFGGPTVAPPSRDGFGSMLLKRVLSQQIRAEVKVDFAPEGFRLRMAVPLHIER
ncbi:HWE histidine kinase domain-containing protein [Methylocapsa sp. D3K7]|uniref:sensor histidine kinase n=1 Tax=Methylocapsa sp. D3K7 TaxID=3041435 RepID=UPI00244EF1BD|nr:HWE histidine kinase domain-containing protein [Methylocapsa sp. D3K7]WGJ14009.1 HWE histidine kinase domain-containing protein [Methylocapsa sp. D3K7]